MSNNSTSGLSSLQKSVKQLRFEASIRRMKVSQAAEELKTFCLKNAPKDPLLVGMSASDNPFRPPKSCVLL
ncbi:guanine nucleotide-binding protein G(I)/G(S)/G(O) subunit gamma-5-like [Danio aesculapii]|uniref:guanine nucleotide-binding protein G(I)/G(S)/G(O) subunit gamma-5-like n=1 Tax=Danio aesculapii TaxID=1142201 RepID=UPI0024C06BA6|nr:guanine nucleotide-binding protein G(I)/G(S)/G(O) subunit gamma-5-like [Danio aesculapii]